MQMCVLACAISMTAHLHVSILFIGMEEGAFARYGQVGNPAKPHLVRDGPCAPRIRRVRTLCTNTPTQNNQVPQSLWPNISATAMDERVPTTTDLWRSFWQMQESYLRLSTPALA